MPRNGSGQFVLPPSNPVVPDTLIATSWANPTLSDIAAALSTSIATDGQTPPTANLPMAGFRHTNVGAALALTQYARADQVQSWALNVVSNISADVTNTVFAGIVPFGIGNGAVAIPTLMPLEFVPSANNGGPSTLALNGGPAYPILNSDLSPLSTSQLKGGRPYALTFLGGNWILLTNTLDLTQLNTQYVRLAGSTMTGPLILSQNPTDPAGAATKQYVDAAIIGGTAGVATFNTRTGAVVLLSGDVTSALSYTPANIAGSTFTGNVAAPQISANKITAPVITLTADVRATATGAQAIDAALTQNHIWTLTGNITISVTNAVAGQILRIMLLSTTGRTVTWPVTTFWPMPSLTAPVIDGGTAKACLVVLEYTGSNWLANASVY
jgi:hypothetical protein